MAQKDARTIQVELARPFAPEDLEWRLQKTIEAQKRGIAVPFVTNRAIQNRLDEVVGPDCWYNDYKPWHTAGKKEAQICGISIYFEGRGFITKWDGAEDPDIEPIKGGLSDSMKRAAVQWGIGRILYNMEPVWVGIEQRGKSWCIQKSERAKLDRAYLDMLDALGMKPAPAGGIRSVLESGGPVPEEQWPAEARSATPAVPPTEGGTAQRGTAKTSTQKTGPAASVGQEQSACAYTVTAMQIRPGMTSSSTSLRLKNAEGREITAFAQGEHPMLAPGTRISEAKLAMRQQDTVVYYILESYRIVPPEQQAA